LQVQRATDPGGTEAHRAHPDAITGTGLPDPNSVVAHGQLNHRAADPNVDPDVLAFGVFERIRYGFLRDAQ